jgi:hypothetical protein
MIRILQLQTKISARANLADERVTSEARTVGLIASCARRRDQPKDSTPRYGRGLLLVDCRRAAIILFAAGPRSGRLRPAASHRPADRQRQAGGFSAAGWSSRCVDTAANAATALSSRAGALELLAGCSAEGCPEGIMRARGFSIDFHGRASPSSFGDRDTRTCSSWVKYNRSGAATDHRRRAESARR